LKKIKLKLLSLALCVCICLSFFTGCSLFTTKNDGNNEAVALKIAGENVTKQELINAYYSFYQSNQYYFMYYDEETIMNVFYDAIIAREIVLVEANKLLDSGKIKFTQEDIDDIWNDVYDSIYTQIDTKEKNLLLLKDDNEENLPKRLQTEDDEDKEKAYKYEAYECEELVKIDYSTKDSAPEVSIDAKIKDFKDGVYTYNASTEEDGRDMQPILEAERAVRGQAYEMYLSDLMLSAKANNKPAIKEDVLKEEIERLYESNYETALYNKYQELVESTAAGHNYDGLTNYDKEDGKFENKLSDDIIERKYKELLNKSAESNSVYENYVSVITASDNESLILYHHDGKYTYFTVQHILVSFDDEVLEILKDTDGYDTAKDSIFREPYEDIRETYSHDDDMKTSYRDENGYTVKDSDGKEIKVSVTDIRNAFIEEYNKRMIEFNNKVANGEIPQAREELERTRVSTLLFNEFAWKYSGDTGSLTNEKLSGVLGFTISSETDEHGSFVKDFTNGARELYEDYADGSKKIGEVISSVVSDYGTHMMMLTGVYEAGAVAETIDELKTTYVSNLTEQTLYEYVYDIVKASLVGDNGTYFADYRKALVKYYNDNDLIKWVSKMSYKTLSNAIN